MIVFWVWLSGWLLLILPIFRRELRSFSDEGDLDGEAIVAAAMLGVSISATWPLYLPALGIQECYRRGYYDWLIPTDVKRVARQREIAELEREVLR